MTQGITPYTGHTNPTYSRNTSGNTHPTRTTQGTQPYILKKQLREHTPYKNNSGHTQPYILKKQLRAHTPYKNNSGHTQPYILKKQLREHTP